MKQNKKKTKNNNEKAKSISNESFDYRSALSTEKIKSSNDTSFDYSINSDSTYNVTNKSEIYV